MSPVAFDYNIVVELNCFVCGIYCAVNLAR